ncbi:AAA family ATPase [Microlunatus ginsengisoli]|uniref:AAA family ATPase n=1 Tax=Microlunatus ginsengisoli TaxID=363863 RepID=A0ABP7AT21_9ACTN
MTRVSLISSSAELRDRLQPLTGSTAFSPAGGTGDPASLLAQFTGLPPEVLIMDCRADANGKLALAAVLIETYPATGVLLVSDRPGDLALPAMRVGVQDILPPYATLAEFGDAVEAVASATRNRVAQLTEVPAEVTRVVPAGQVVSVMSPKGGVGKTTVATNIAVGLAQRAPGSTVIVDLDVQFGDVASGLDLEPHHFLADVVHGAARYDAVVMKTFLTQHKSGLYAICAPNVPSDADKITADDISHLLHGLAAEFRYVVIDTAPGMSETTLAALDATTDLILLSSMDVPGIRGLRKELDTIRELELTLDSRRVVLNFADHKGLLSVADVEATIGTRVDLALPRSKAALTSVNQGIPLLQSGVRDPLTKHLRNLVDRIATPTRPGRTVESPVAGAKPSPQPASRWQLFKKKGTVAA